MLMLLRTKSLLVLGSVYEPFEDDTMELDLMFGNDDIWNENFENVQDHPVLLWNRRILHNIHVFIAYLKGSKYLKR